jgi:hypothetical protein
MDLSCFVENLIPIISKKLEHQGSKSADVCGVWKERIYCKGGGGGGFNIMIICFAFPAFLSLSHTHTHILMSTSEHDESRRRSEDKEMKNKCQTDIHIHNCLWAFSSFAWASPWAMKHLEHEDIVEHDQSDSSRVLEEWCKRKNLSVVVFLAADLEKTLMCGGLSLGNHIQSHT